ncbi:hypothetical protein O0L34_g8206 [Tuta absoluta]|nr:hypothetical protein O0L34_g8206 [Tuta absoluta]
MVSQYQTERRLTWCYAGLGVLLAVSVICSGIAYSHWRATLDVCPGGWLENTNCGCIFFGTSTYQYFNGGHNSYCLYAIFALIPIMAYAIIMALFHMYRVCINNIGQFEDDKTTAMDEIEGESIVVTSRARVTENNDAVIYCWIPSSCIAAVFCIYNIVHAAIITNGFLRTCTQYRGYLVRVMNVAGDQASAIHFRLGCQAIFDFMDYTQQNSLVPRHGDFINTGAALQLALIASWISVLLWIAVAVYSALRAYRERDVLTCCGN